MRHLHPARPLLTLAAACLMASPLASPQTSSQTAPQTAPVTVLVTPAAVAPASTPEALAKQLEGKTFFLRGFYQDEHLEFDTAGKPLHGLQKGSFALSGVEIDKVKFTKHSMEIQAHRVGLHFFGALPYEDDTKPFEKIKVDPKKSMNISIERLVIEPEKKKKKKELEKEKEAKALAAKSAAPAYKEAALATVPDAPEADTTSTAADTAAGTVTTTTDTATIPAAAPAATTTEASAAPTIAPNHDPRVSFLELSKAANVIFAPGLDDSVISTLPAYWQNYFATKAGRARAAKVDASTMRPGGEVKPPQLMRMIDPASNDYAQKNNIAGMVFLQTVVDTQGHPGEVTIVRPIGFGLDEKAVEAVEHSQFHPGTFNGKAVPELVNLQVTFRIYSNRTRPNAVPAGTPTQVAPKESPKMPPSNAPVLAAATVSE